MVGRLGRTGTPDEEPSPTTGEGPPPLDVELHTSATVSPPDLPALAEWLARQVAREPEAAALVEGRRVEPDAGSIAAALEAGIDGAE